MSYLNITQPFIELHFTSLNYNNIIVQIMSSGEQSIYAL